MARVCDGSQGSSNPPSPRWPMASVASRPLSGYDSADEGCFDSGGVNSLSRPLSFGGDDRDSPIEVMQLRQGLLMQDSTRRRVDNVVNIFARVLPAAVIYGGTAGLFVCAIRGYRWGVLLSLMLYSFYMLHLSTSFLLFSALGLMKVWLASRERWYALYCKEREQRVQCEADAAQKKFGCETCERPPSLSFGGPSLSWHDVLHVVIVPSFKTPIGVLEGTVDSLRKFSLATSNMGLCLAFEEREECISAKAALLKERFSGSFRFVTTTLHPPNMPNHVPGKSSNECWAFSELRRELSDSHNVSLYDPRVVITVIDDDSEMHEEYFEALTYSFVASPEECRYLTIWQPPICHFKNYLRQPALVRISSIFATLAELSYLANPMDCHVNYSSYSLSLVLASAVGGWDPDYLAEDWHMFAKCSLMTSGRVRCKPIFLPLLNYTPEEDTYWGTLHSRWVQAKRHALGVSEVVYVIQMLYLGLLEAQSWRRRFFYMLGGAPLLGKFAQVHFVNGMSAVLSVMAQLVIHFYMFRSWCYMLSPEDTSCGLAMASATELGVTQEQIVLNSWMVYWQQRATAGTAVIGVCCGGLGAAYFQLVKDRVEGDVNKHFLVRHPVLHCVYLELLTTTLGAPSSIIYGAAPLWIAVGRVVCEARFTHVVAGMVGRSSSSAEM